MTQHALEAKLSRAKGYPYARPDSSFVFLSGSTLLFRDNEWAGPQGLSELPITSTSGHQPADRLGQALERRGMSAALLDQSFTPVLAIGSNAAPQQLARKFPADRIRGGVLIPVVRAVLQGFDVVYAPLLASYGSCAATLEVSPGTAVELFVTFLAPDLLEHMHSTEGSYDLVRLSKIRLHLGSSLSAFRDNKPPAVLLSSILQYNHQLGSFEAPLPKSAARSPIALKAIPALGRAFPALDQSAMLAALQLYLASREANAQEDGMALPVAEVSGRSKREGVNNSVSNGANNGFKLSSSSETSLDFWILQHIDSAAIRHARNATLAERARPFRYAHAEIVATLGQLHEGAP